VKVEIFDTGRVAGEASWASAGMLAPGGEYETGSPMTRISLASLASWPAFATELGVAFQNDGAIEVAFTDEEADALRERARHQAEAGIPSEPAHRPECVVARRYPNDAVVDPREVTAALRAACERLRVHIHEQQAVTSLEALANEDVLVAAGAWAAQLLPLQPRRIRCAVICWGGTRSPER